MYSPPIPLYYTIKDDIIEQIDNEEYRPGEAIASEKVLMEKYGVSRTTVRRAIELLVNDGYLYIIRGKGTFVKGKKYAQSVTNFSSCTEMLREMHIKPFVEVLKNEVCAPMQSIRSKLGLAEGERVFHLERLNSVENIPINYTRTFLPYKYLAGIEEYDFSVLSLYEIMRDVYGIEIGEADRTVEAVLPPKGVAEILGVTQETPVLKFNAVVYGKRQDSRLCIEAYKTYFRTDRIKFIINSKQ